MTSSCAGEEMAESTSSLDDKEEEISEDTVAGLRRKRPTVSYRSSAVALEILLGKALHLHEVFDYPLSKLDPCSAHSDPPVIAVYETLVNKGPDGEAHPGLAASWEVSDDKLTWAFRLRPNARFHSGDACDAEAVEAACERIRYGFHGGKEFFYWNPVDQVRADSALKLVITLHHPYPRLPSILWGPHSVIHNDRRRATDPDGSGADWADGTGPFRFVSYSPEKIEVERLTQDDAVHQRVAEGLRDQLKKIGVVLELRPIRSFHAFYEGCKAGPPAFLNKWLWQDPMDAIVGFIASWGRPDPNWHHSSLPVLDEAFRAWLRAETPEKLQAIASRIQMLVREHLPYIPLLVPQDVWVHAKAVKNWSPAQSILYPFYHRTAIDR